MIADALLRCTQRPLADPAADYWPAAAPRARSRFCERVTTAIAVASRRERQTSLQPLARMTTMTFSTRIGLGVSAALVALSVALSPAAFAQDKMGKDDAMKKDSMSKDTMSKDGMSKHDGMKKSDGMMKKDDAMKKDDGMKKN
jgi:pentapeptide MXKDX repeat protein